MDHTRKSRRPIGKFCELTDATWVIGAELERSQMKREDDRERADALSGPCCACTRAVVIASTLRDGQDAVDPGLETLICTEQDQLADVLAELCPVLLPRLTRESCIEQVQPAREEECSNSDMLSTMARSCTLYIPAQLPSVHSLIKCSTCSYPH